ncbi:MAG: NAD(P)/FAD-dependent oxidoreductase [Actinobacteria bacterium]|nr:NAD(P)/FAD-dependent oxidoreductase [Actinomycetota bacterium]
MARSKLFQNTTGIASVAQPEFDAVVVGAGPNGLAAAARIAKAGGKVLVLEANAEIGGGVRSFDHNGYRHDSCSTIHSLPAIAPPLELLGLVDGQDSPVQGRHRASATIRWAHFPIELAHPLPDGDSAFLYRDVRQTAEGLGQDARRYQRLIGGLVDRWDHLASDVLTPMVSIPRHPVSLARFGLPALLPAAAGLRRLFVTEQARALLGGNAAHSYVALNKPLTMAFGLMLQIGGHVGGWPVAAGGSSTIASGLASVITSNGGTIETSSRVTNMAKLPSHRTLFLDTTPAVALSISGLDLPWHRNRAYRNFGHGAAAFKVDFELSGPIPWADPQISQAGTVHLVGRFDELVAAESTVASGRMPDRPFVLAVQACVADPQRAPSGHHTLWTYAHVPSGFAGDALPHIEGQLDRFAPGWRDLVVHRHVTTPAALETGNANFAGGDIGGGSYGGLQSVARPTFGPHPYRTGAPGVYLCSASTPPGAGAHGMGGWNAVADALKRELRHLT